MAFIKSFVVVTSCTLLLCCNRKTQQNNTEENAHQGTEAAAVVDTVNLVKPVQTIQAGKDTLNIKSPVFMINGLQCYWSYTAACENQSENPAYNAHIIFMELKLVENDRVLLRPGISYDLQNEFYNIKDLMQQPQAVLACEDINHDSWCDYKVLFERAAAGANETTDAFLFNPQKKRFEHSKLFSGTNMEYDTAKNMIKTFWKMGYDNYTYTYTYLKPNKKEINYIIEETVDGDVATITKIVKGRIVKRTKNVIAQ